jgi:hypothetical protein
MRAKLLAYVEQDAIDGATIADWIAQDESKELIEFDGEKYTRESLI